MSVAIPQTRRSFLRYVGVAAASAAVAPFCRGLPLTNGHAPELAWIPVPYPVPLPGDLGSPDEDADRLATFSVVDDLVLPRHYVYDVVTRWGDRVGAPGHEITVGYNADYTALLPIEGAPDEFHLVVNHEYISARPWLQGYPAVFGRDLVTDGKVAGVPLEGLSLSFRDADAIATLGPDAVGALRSLCRAALEDLGVSVLRVRRYDGGRYAVIPDATDHRRIHGLGRVNVDPAAPFEMTGPLRGWNIQLRGTFANCSGGTTPWNTVLTCEENFQDQVPDAVAPDGTVPPWASCSFDAQGRNSATRLPQEFGGLGDGIEPRIDPRGCGWVCEIDPRTGALFKHTALGRFRHENVALRCEAGRRLAAYMGDDRRGGHIWKFVSDEVVKDPRDPGNRRLLERGTLHVARFNRDQSGAWIPLAPETPLRKPEPQHCATGHLLLPRRPRGGLQAVSAPGARVTGAPVESWEDDVSAFAAKPFAECRLRDLVAPHIPDPLAVLLLDAFAMANAIGGTPTARPEDIEVHPHDGSIYIAFTDSSGFAEGSPDVRVFPDSLGRTTRQYGALYRIVEADDDPAATSFGWGRFVSSGEAADGGGGFACADNLAFDRDANLWMVTDITTSALNFPVTREGESEIGSRFFPGVFGNNAMFFIATSGPDAGVPRCFATGPMECELTGPTFTPEGHLLLAVQHPGEIHGARGHRQVDQPLEVTGRQIQIVGRDGQPFTQSRLVPLGSNFPDGRHGVVPRPCVVCIRRI